MYKNLNTKFEQLVVGSKVTFEDIEKLAHMHDYTFRRN